jgi:hypothetical protein
MVIASKDGGLSQNSDDFPGYHISPVITILYTRKFLSQTDDAQGMICLHRLDRSNKLGIL